MSRIPQQRASRGSQKWLQILVNDYPEIFARELAKLGLSTDQQIKWLSPLKDDEYAEYRDKAFVERLGVNPSTPLTVFWPKGGPVWDALAKTPREELVLIEAKAHIGEIVSPRTRASGASLAQICASLKVTQRFLGAASPADWSVHFYQYTNRLAHLYWLREVNRLPAYMVFLYFINDHDMDGPTTREEWEGAIQLMQSFLGLRRHKLSAYVLDVFVDVTELEPARKSQVTGREVYGT